MLEDADRPMLLLAMGDPAGIGAELSVKLLADRSVADAADILLIGDRRVLAMGERQAGIRLELPDLDGFAARGQALADLGHLDPEDITVGQPSAAGGDFALVNFRVALKMAAAGIADGVTMTPLNTSAMRLAESDYVDEIDFIARTLGAAKDGIDIVILDEIENARETFSTAPADEPGTFSGVDRGVILFDGCHFPITTPVHGTAYDIAGEGKADAAAARHAILISAGMARRAAGERGFPDRETRVGAVRGFFRGGHA